MTVGDRGQGGIAICERLDAADLADLDQRSDATPGDAAFVEASEERVFAIKSYRADQVFDSVGVDLDATVGQEGLQTSPMVMDVGQLFAQAGFNGGLATLRLQPTAELGHQRRASSLAGREALTGRDATNVGLDSIELGDAAQTLGGNLRAVAVEDFFQFAPRV